MEDIYELIALVERLTAKTPFGSPDGESDAEAKRPGAANNLRVIRAEPRRRRSLDRHHLVAVDADQGLP